MAGPTYTAAMLNMALNFGQQGSFAELANVLRAIVEGRVPVDAQAGVTAGTVTASKPLVVDANKDISALRNVGLVNLDAGSSGVAGSVDIFPSTASKGKLAITVADATGNTTTGLTVALQAAARTYTIADYGADTTLLAAVMPPVAITATGSITQAANAGRRNMLGASALATLTLPAATGTGDVYMFQVKTLNTSNHVIQKAGSDVFRGQILNTDADATAVISYVALGTASYDVLTLNGTTTGGQIGDWVEFTDVVTGVWGVRGMVVCPASSNPATPFS